MKVTVSPHAAQEGTLRIWLRRIPVSSQIIYAFRSGHPHNRNEPVSQAFIYGRGEGSSASEHVMLLFRPGENIQPFQVGEELTLKVRDEKTGHYQEIELDVTHIE
ncbi:hypothetical protein [Photobacterium galatheae]|uniref:Uncharacterized protein n=2 Tax=Photobacterium galatheae TaxID=1654360 RepID=A0A066RV69_9GAMM|nr:hypothetical protein [Photobacterium galatheae]KDM91268.1 hypothetical protein EA58_11885 [Photobacterium galatheae]